MGFAKTYGGTVLGVNATLIEVEVNVGGGGQLSYFLVGLPDAAVKEGQHRIETAMKTNDYELPRQKIVINMAPADLRKEGSAYDLTLAIGIMEAMGQLNATEEVSKYIIMGELSLEGKLRPIKGALPIAIQARREKFKGFILPKENAREAAIVDDINVYGAETLDQVVNFLRGTTTIEPLYIPAKNFTKI